MKSLTASMILWTRADGYSDGERMVSEARRANVRDLVEKACQIETIGTIIAAGTCRDMTKALKDYPVVVEPMSARPAVPFGKSLGSIVGKHGGGTLLYMGGGSGVFMEIEDLARLTEVALASPDVLMVNNFYSTDFAAFGRHLKLRGLSRCQQDNQLGWVLGREEGVRTRVLPSSLATRFDIDTPADLMILRVHLPRGRHLSAAVSRLPIESASVSRVMDVLVDRGRHAVIAGRIPPEVALSFDRETACHLRFYIEARGMEARQQRTGIWSLLGLCLEESGLSRFYQTISNHADAVILDSRVVFSHLGLQPSRQDRFFSDLCRPDEITDPAVRRFTREALRSPIPWILGGHTLVSGGLLALAKSAWKRVQEPPRRDAEDLPNGLWEANQPIGS
jgi:hypothetical protein